MARKKVHAVGYVSSDYLAPAQKVQAVDACDPAYLPVVQLVILRGLVRCNGVAEFIDDDGFSDSRVARVLGCSEAASRYSKPSALRALQRQLDELEKAGVALPIDTVIAGNIRLLGDRLGLQPADRDILHLTVLGAAWPEIDLALDLSGKLTHGGTCQLLADCLGRPIQEIRNALDERAPLARSAILVIDRSRSYSFSSKIETLEGICDELLLQRDDLLDLFGSSVLRSPPPNLELDDYTHLSEDVSILRQYMQTVCSQRQRGANVLIYGRPGTGKTELVRALVQAIGRQLLEIPTEAPNGEPRPGKARFHSYRFAQTLLAADDDTVLLFDEVEDVFNEPTGTRHMEGNASGIKGWVNKLLENNPVPSFWVTNHLHAIDPAYLRRFDYVLHLDMPPASVRLRVVEHHTAALTALSQQWREDAAGHADMAPAVVARAAKVSLLVCGATSGLDAERVMTRLMNNTLQALETHAIKPKGQAAGIEYDIELLNADCDLQRLREGLRHVGEGRICLYGPPGTGKSAFGRHLADALDRPLLVKRASDVLSPYVGMAEKNIALMFEEAESEGAVLLFDEADSLLRDRQGAQRSWEVTQVNEMLTQMETYPGIFIASTNLMDSLDPAAMRRFDARVRLRYMKPAQAVSMFTTLAASMELAPHDMACAAVNRLDVLTPGDFAAAARLCRLDRPNSAMELAQRLRQACEEKKEPIRRAIGFAA
jgi:SpoVK/Ycf46/Vps4 family AAA+-type ATPase